MLQVSECWASKANKCSKNVNIKMIIGSYKIFLRVLTVYSRAQKTMLASRFSEDPVSPNEL